jgi:hypothetical protein
MGNVVISVFLKYIESHPDVIEKLIALAVDALIKHLNAPQTN